MRYGKRDNLTTFNGVNRRALLPADFTRPGRKSGGPLPGEFTALLPPAHTTRRLSEAGRRYYSHSTRIP